MQQIFCNYYCIQIIVHLFLFQPQTLHLYQPMHRNILSLHPTKLLLYCPLSHSWFCPTFLPRIHLYLIDTLLFPSISPLAYLYILPLLSLTSRYPLEDTLSSTIKLLVRAGAFVYLFYISPPKYFGIVPHSEVLTHIRRSSPILTAFFISLFRCSGMPFISTSRKPLTITDVASSLFNPLAIRY